MAILKPVIWGIAAAAALLGVYFTIVGAISGRAFAASQFLEFWYFIITLAVGFGVQVGLYARLREMARGRAGSKKIVAVSGATSTAAMISCCAHYLANLIPLIGVSGAIALIGQYQVELFWVGLLMNAIGVVYIIRSIKSFSRT